MTDFCILGSGVAGSTIASLLKKRSSVHVIEKARGPGGRASNKKLTKNFNFNSLANLDGIGETQIKSLKNFFSDQVNLNVVKKLISILNIKNALEKIGKMLK